MTMEKLHIDPCPVINITWMANVTGIGIHRRKADSAGNVGLPGVQNSTLSECIS